MNRRGNRLVFPVALLVLVIAASLPSAFGTPIPDLPPSSPTALSSLAPLSLSAIHLSWSNPVGPTILNNTVYFSLSGGCQDSLWQGHSTGGAATTYTMSSLSPNTKFCVAVTAWDADGESKAVWGNFTTLPGPVGGLFLSGVTTSSLTLTWSNGGGSVALVNDTIFRGTACGVWTAISTGSAVTTYTVGSLAGGTRYCVAVCVWNGIGMTNLCGWGNFSTIGVAPSNIRTSSPYPSQIAVTWINPSGIVINDTVRYGTSYGSWSVVSLGMVATSYTISGLVPASAYCVSVQAWSNDGSTGVVYANQTTIADAVSGILISQVVPHGAKLTWTNPSEAFTNVSVIWSLTSCGPPIGQASLGVASTYTITGLSRGILYCISLRTWTFGGGSNSSAISLQTPTQLPFGPPTAVHQITQDSNSVTLGWTNPNVPLSNNTIWYGPNCSSLTNPVSTRGAVSSFRILGLTAVTNYCWAVQAWNYTGFNSSFSVPIYASTGAYNGQPICVPPACVPLPANVSAGAPGGIPTLYIVVGVLVAASIGIAAVALETGGSWNKARRKR